MEIGAETDNRCQETYPINVKRETAANQTLHVCGSWCVGTMKYHIQSLMGIARSNQVVYFGSPERQLDDSEVVAACGIVRDAQIRVAPL